MAKSLHTLPSALLPAARHDEDAASLKAILGRIYDERGHFRHMTEASLEAEMAADEGQDNSSDTDDEEDGAVEAQAQDADGGSRREQLQAARMEMVGHVASAQNEALMALDFVSLLLSKDAPKQAELTMSPHLKQFVNPGTLGMDMWSNMPVDKEAQATDETISRSWRIDSLQNCADSLLDAAARLQKTVKRETRYWENVLSVSEKGWSICRMPREKHNLGVRFGFLEALGEYRDRGLAALRADEAGNVVLDKGFGNDSKTIRVRTTRNGRVIASSTPPQIPADAATTLETRIRAARDSLYEEELFYDIIRESRTLGSYGVEMRGSTISIPTRLDAHQSHLTASTAFDTVLIDLVSTDTIDSSADEEQAHHIQQAQAIALVFRLLLSYTHRERLRRRSQIPPPMALSRHDTPVAPILRPVMALLHHQSLSAAIDTHLDRLEKLLSRASITASMKRTQLDSSSLRDSAENMHLLVGRMMKPITSRASLSLSTSSSSETYFADFTLHIHTSSLTPALGSRINLALSSSPTTTPSLSSTNGNITTIPSSADFTDVEDLVDYLDAMLSDSLAQQIASSSPPSSSSSSPSVNNNSSSSSSSSGSNSKEWRYNDRTGIVSSSDDSRRIVVRVDGSLGTLVLDSCGAGRDAEWRLGVDVEDGEQKKGFWSVVEDMGRK
ncbi:hypothetical protein AAFC00_005887 [Neodothiora populina]|uniref:Mediator of RNA polymerase II transcription subunit 17 n=1 Tax=Neodothiora populina TaxID=2781224 RepID=A0ABR3P671_9PEZI